MTRTLTLALALAALAADWPQFRGPDAAGVADGTNPPVKWSASEGVRWKVPLPGKGLANPVVAGGKVFVTACSGPDQERLHVLAFDLATGKPLWERQLAATGRTMCHRESNMAAPSPAASDSAVFAFFGSGDLAAFDHAGNLLWYRSLVGDYPNVVNNLGLASSLVLYEDVLIVPLDSAGDDSLLLGVSAADGTNRWKAARPRGVNWTTPLVVRRGAGAELYVQAGADRRAYDPRTGAELWKLDTGGSTMPSPVASGGRVVTFADGLVALEQSPGGGPPAAAWKAPGVSTQYSTPLVYRGRVYTVNRAGALHATDLATGKPAWKDPPRLKGKYWGSPVAADGRLYATNAEGLTTVVELGETPKVLSTNPLGPGLEVQASPVLADGAVLIRAHTHLVCAGGKPAG